MKLQLAVLLALFTSTQAQNLFLKGGDMIGVRKNTFGNIEIIDTDQDGSIRKNIQLKAEKYERDYVAQTEFLKDAMKQIKINEEQIKAGRIYKCSDKPGTTGVLDFFPIFVGEIGGLNAHTLPYKEGRCFQNVEFDFTRLTDSSGVPTSDIAVTINASSPKTSLCSDIFFFGTSEFHHLEDVTKEGKTTLIFKNLNEQGVIDVVHNGVKVFMFCSGYTDIFASVWKTILAFVGGLSPDPDLPIIGSHVPPYMEAANIEFLETAMGYKMEVRETERVEIDPSYIQSGDFIAIMRLDGLDPLIMYGTGGHAGHTVMALRMDGELYIVESQDGWYWPHHGIQKNKWSDWIQYADNADFHLVHMPLNDEMRAKFNETAAIEFFK